MPSKSASSSAGKTSEQDDAPLQAVILADTYNERLKPLTATRPRCLLPICNTSLLDWTLECLALTGVHDVFVVCTSHVELIKEALASSRHTRSPSPLHVQTITTSPSCFAPGEALRDIYTHGVISSDFILVFGDLVSCVRLDEVVRLHRERRKEDPDVVMTVVMRQAGAECRTRPLGDTGVFVTDADSGELLHYEAVQGIPLKRGVKIPRDAIAGHRNVDIRNDLIDCGIDICSVEVPSLFQDNFDYLDIRKDFVRGILTSDLLAKKIYCHVIKNGYAARVRDTKSYAMISKDILSRWTYPLVPDGNNPSGQAFEHRWGNTYIPQDGSVILSRSCKIGPKTMIGPKSCIGAQALVMHSVVGADCEVGTAATLRDSYLFDGVRVGAGCMLEWCIVGRNVVLGEGSVLEKGAVIGDGVVLGRGARIPMFGRVEKGEGGDRWKDVLGTGSNGVFWIGVGSSGSGGDGDEEDEEDEAVGDELETVQNLELLRIGDETELGDLEALEVYSSSSDEEEKEESSCESSAEESGGFEAKLKSGGEAEFLGEARASLERAWREGHTVENAAVELKTLRMASNVKLRRVREAVVAFLVGKIVDSGRAREMARGVVKRWGGLITAIGGVDGVETIEILQRECKRDGAVFGMILAGMYEEDIVEEDDVREWHGKEINEDESCWIVGSRMLEQLDSQNSD